MAATFGMAAGSASAKGIGVVSPKPGQLDVFMRVPDGVNAGRLAWAEWTQYGGWTPWQVFMNGYIHPDSEISAVSRSTEFINVYARGTSNQLISLSYSRNGGGWANSWTDLGGVLSGGPSAVVFDSNHEQVYVAGSDSQIYQKYWINGQDWSQWNGLGKYVKPGTGPAVTSRQYGTLDMSYIENGSGQLMVMGYQPGLGGWFGPYGQGGVATSSPGMAARRDAGLNSQVDYVVRGTDGQAYYKAWISGNFTGFDGRGGNLAANAMGQPIWWQDSPSSPLRFDILSINASMQPEMLRWIPGQGWNPGGWDLLRAKDDQAFVFADAPCDAATQWGSGARLGISLGQYPSRIGYPTSATNGETIAFWQVKRCLEQVTAGRAPIDLRIQLSIDAARRSDGLQQIAAFGRLLQSFPGAQGGVVSIKPYTFTQCSKSQLVQKTSLAAGQTLAACQYPSAALYKQLFQEINAQVASATGYQPTRYSAWNEPDHPSFGLRPAEDSSLAAKQAAIKIAGTYFAAAAQVIGVDRVLAGELASSPRSEYQQSFVDGARTVTAGLTPTNWADHPYGDMTPNSSLDLTFPRSRAFASQTYVSGKPVWLTEVGTQLRVGSTLQYPNGNAVVQHAGGGALRTALRSGTRAYLYEVSNESENTWDSSATDRNWRARPVICGLGGLPANLCDGNLNALN